MLQPTDELEPEDVRLVLVCPFCGRTVPYPGVAGDGSELLAECDRCDVYFGFDPEEVYTIGAELSTSVGSNGGIRASDTLQIDAISS
jgi:hypothetical protein